MAKVEINKEKPTRGSFVVRVDGVDKPVVELTDLKRPFPALKALDMDAIVSQIQDVLEQS